MPTIVPLTPEGKWLGLLSDLPLWEPPLVPTLILAPHPDDETLRAGGLIAKLREEGIPVRVVAVTDGENAYADRLDLGQIRVPEQVQALRRLGVPLAMIHRFNLPDRDVTLHEERLLALLRSLVSSESHIVAPWPFDFHPDHESTGRVAQRLAIELGLSISFYLFWTWHRGTPRHLDGLNLVSLQLSESQLAIKNHALKAHQSQFAHPDGQPILSSELLEPARRPFEVYIQ